MTQPVPAGAASSTLHVAAAGPLERFLRGLERELRVVVLPREVGQHDVPARLSQALLQEPPHVAVREVPERPEDALLERPGVRPVAEHRGVVVGLEENGGAAAKGLDETPAQVAEVRGVAEGHGSCRHHERERGGGVVGNRDGPQREVADRAGLPGGDRLPGRQLRLGEAGRPEGAARERERHSPPRREGRGPARVVAVLVRDEDGVERGGVHPRRLQPLRERARSQARVQQHARSAPFDERGVAPAPGAQHAEAEAHTRSSRSRGRQPRRLPRTLAASRPSKTSAATRRTSSALTASMPPRISSRGNCRPK